MKRWLKEPLLHFAVLGALLFAGYGAMHRSVASSPERIVVSQGQQASMLEGFTRARQRPPTREEWDGLIAASVREEVYCREALALGLDKDDVVIRRRLQQKMEFISDDAADRAEPTDEELNAYLQAHPDTFRLERRFSFRQVYLDPQKHGDHLAGDAARALVTLNQPGGDAGFATLGDPFLLGGAFAAATASEVARQFGQEFASRLDDLQPGPWQGPVASAFGAHLICLSERTDARLPSLAEVRDAVRREWDDARRTEANETFYRNLLKHYTVVVEPPSADGKAAPGAP